MIDRPRAENRLEGFTISANSRLEFILVTCLLACRKLPSKLKPFMHPEYSYKIVLVKGFVY